MDQLILSRIEKFASLTPQMHSSFQETVKSWQPELPPLTTLFSILGSSFIDEFDSLDDERKELVFEAIESMLKGDNEALDIGATTGFLEAIVVKPNFSKKAKDMLGENSRLFLREWSQFMNIQDSDL